MLLNWPDELDQFLLDHILDTKDRLNNMLNTRYDRILQTYNKKYKLNWIGKDEFRHAYNAVKS